MAEMTEAQQDHVDMIANRVIDRLYTKYEAGVKEHGGNLWNMPVREVAGNAFDEAIDQAVYIVTMLEQIDLLLAENTMLSKRIKELENDNKKR